MAWPPANQPQDATPSTPTSGYLAAKLNALSQGVNDTAAGAGAASGLATLDGASRVPTAQLGSGTPSSSTFLRGDRTWAVPPSGTGSSGGFNPGWFDVTAAPYNAVGDGVADDTAAINAAANDVRTQAKGGVVYCNPSKKFNCAGRLDFSYINGLNFVGGAGNTAVAGDIANQYSIVYSGGDQAATVTLNATTTMTASTAIFKGAHVGTIVTGPGIPAGAYIESVPGLSFNTRTSTSAVLNVPATQSATVSVSIAAPFIDGSGTFGITIANLKIHTNNPAFTGDIVALTNAPGYGDASSGLIDSCVIGGTTAPVGNARCCVSYRAAIIQKMHNTSCFYAVNLVIGKTVPTGNVYANAIQLENCQFLKQQQWAIKNSHEIWYIKGCTFEPRQDNAAAAYKDELGAFGPCIFQGCWFGDTGDIGAGAPPWIQYKGRMLVVRDSLLNSPRGTGGIGIILDSTGGTGGITGVLLEGNEFFSMQPVVKTVAGGAAIDCFTAICNTVTGNPTQLLDDSGTAVTNKILLGNSNTTDGDVIGTRPTFAQGLTLLTLGGPVSDNQFNISPPTGTVGGVDTLNSRLYVKVGSTWKYATLQ